MEKSDFLPKEGMRERFLAFCAAPRGRFADEARDLLDRFRESADGMTPLMVRFHLSDITNQAGELRTLLKREGFSDTAWAMIGQFPLSDSKIALEAWLTDRPVTALRFLPGAEPAGTGSFDQMRRAFLDLEKTLPPGCSIADNLLRTWIYCRDIDNHYAGLVRARREYFAAIGLTARTHYIASTGIAGCSEKPSQLVRMDSLLAGPGTLPEQFEYMRAPEHLSPTHVYGVTFERGTRLAHRDRSHYFLSGTASIDKEGRIVHPGNVAAQTERALDNVAALLENHQGTLSDLRQAVVYLRDPSDCDTVEKILEKRIGNHCVRIMLHAPVCRPGWLVELEGIAVNDCGGRQYPIFT